ncbi:MAG TPA: hypothetical protein VN721_08900 [Flavipsychrobacter sp.]|nr:hypothetical protein [Flavipsychrobacter sp.]
MEPQSNDKESRNEKKPDAQKSDNKETPKKEQPQENKKKHTSALEAASIGRSATAQVDPHSNSGLANTGTNISYEGATAPASGGSVGTGYSSGKEATGETLSTNSDYEQNRATKENKKDIETENTNDEEEDADEEKDII